ncbi:MAG: HAD-IA family hydrolase [Rhodobacteraceae bacterium]|nr:HAD-IA family hydrolase [Paracoccaceae bacterium]
MTRTAVIFDIGGVLVDWQPHLAWSEALGSEQAAQDFIVRTDFLARNLRGDHGEVFSEMALELEDLEDQRLFAAYPSLYTRTVQAAIPGTWALLDQLKMRGVPVHAITNWSAETWPEGLKVHPRLGEVFETLVVSGRERMIKPDPAIFHLLCERADVAPQDCVFIDDGLHNVDGARAVGMDGIHFTSPEALEQDLSKRGLL